MNSVESISFILTLLMGGTMVLGFFLILLLLRSDLGMAKWLLSLALLALLLHLMTFLLFTTGLIRQWPHLLGLSYPFLFLAGPSFYFFIKYYAEPRFTFCYWHLIHLIPALAITFYQMPSTYLKSNAEKLQLIEYYYELAPSGVMSIDLWGYFNLYVLLILVYVTAALYYIYRKKPYNTALLLKFAWLYFALSLSYLVLQSGFLLRGADFIAVEVILSALMALVVLLMGYWILDIKQILPVTPSYQTAPLSSHKVEDIKQTIRKSMEDQKLYLNPRLTLSQLAEELQVPAHHLSQVINNHMDSNFYQLINRYRISRSQELLKTERIHQVSIQAIGMDCGFSNKTSFYRAFKQYTGMTPAEFVRS